MELGTNLIKIALLLLFIAMTFFDILYMGNPESFAMKSTQFLSVVFSLIMFTGVTAGNAAVAFADLDDLEEKLEDFCEMTADERLDFFSENSDMAEYEQRLGTICEIEDEEEREDALDELIDEIIPETRDENDHDENDDMDREDKEDNDSHDDDDRDDKAYGKD